MTVAAMKPEVPALSHFKGALELWLESNGMAQACPSQTVSFPHLFAMQTAWEGYMATLHTTSAVLAQTLLVF